MTRPVVEGIACVSTGFHEFDSGLQHAPPGSPGLRVEHRVEFADGLHQPVKPQIIKLGLDVQLRPAVAPGEPFQVNNSFGFTAGQHHDV